MSEVIASWWMNKQVRVNAGIFNKYSGEVKQTAINTNGGINCYVVRKNGGSGIWFPATVLDRV